MLTGLALLATVLVASAALAPAARSRLRERAAALGESREQARRGEVDAARLVPQFTAFADTLEAAGLDSLAALILYRAGGMSGRLARDADAESQLRRSLQIATRARDENLQIRARTLLASQLINRAPEQAIELLRGIEPICIRRKEWHELARARGTLSSAYGSLGRLSEAMRVSRGALDAARRSRRDLSLAEAHNDLSQLLIPRGRKREALIHADSGLAAARRTGVSLQLAVALGTRARALQANGRSVEALAMFREAVHVDRIRGDRQHLMRTRISLGSYYWEMGDDARALAQADSALADARQARNRLMESRATALLALSLANLGRVTEAETTLARAVPRFEGVREGLGSAESQAGLSIRGGEMYATWSRCLMMQGRTLDAWRAAERGRAWALREQLADDDSLASVRALQRLLRESGAVLLQWTENQRNPALAFVITADSLIAVDLGRPQSLAQPQSVWSAILTGRDAANVLPALTAFSRGWLHPLLGRIPASTRRLILVTNRPLADVPLEELPLPDGRSLADRWPLTQTPSASVLLLLQRRSAPPSGMSVWADPSLARTTLETIGQRAGDAVRDRTRQPLPQARAEARAVAAPGARVWMGPEATRSRFMDPERARDAVMHLATHTWIDPRDPDAAGLALAGGDGLVTARDVAALTLPADLVVLSSCASAAGVEVMGEGAFGLPRAFLLAGTRSVVSTRWSVRDAVARRGMELFYAGLRAGLPRDEAMHRMRAQMVRERYPIRDRAAFTLIGVGHEPVRSLRGR